jgi:hypothetical protein
MENLKKYAVDRVTAKRVTGKIMIISLQFMIINCILWLVIVLISNCTVQRGRQMFMLTHTHTPFPLSKAFLSYKPLPQTKFDINREATESSKSRIH